MALTIKNPVQAQAVALDIDTFETFDRLIWAAEYAVMSACGNRISPGAVRPKSCGARWYASATRRSAPLRLDPTRNQGIL